MILHVVEAKYVKDYVICLRFNDGVVGNVDLGDSLDGKVFEPLRNREYFEQFTLDAELNTIYWPNGADFAPEFLLTKLENAGLAKLIDEQVNETPLGLDEAKKYYRTLLRQRMER